MRDLRILFLQLFPVLLPGVVVFADGRKCEAGFGALEQPIGVFGQRFELGDKVERIRARIAQC